MGAANVLPRRRYSMLKNLMQQVGAIVLVVAASPSLASFHLFVLNEFYSNADGTVQFIEAEHRVRRAAVHFMAKPFRARKARPRARSLSHGPARRQYPAGPFSSAPPRFASARPGRPITSFIARCSISRQRRRQSAVDFVSWTALPVDGSLSINRSGVAAINSPKNFAGATTRPSQWRYFSATASGPLTARVLTATVQARPRLM